VQEGGDGFVFVPAVLEHERAGGQQVAHVRDRGALAHLGGMQGRGVLERLLETLAQEGWDRDLRSGAGGIVHGNLARIREVYRPFTRGAR
jgi:hypothetical protein